MLFSRLSLRLLPLIAVLCAVVPSAGGRSLPADEAWENFGFTICDLPCFAGITPGRTPFQQSPSLLRRNIPIIQNRMFNSGTVVHFWASTPDYELAGFTRQISGVVDEIHLTLPLPLDHLIATLGMPDCLIPVNNASSRRATIFWTRRQVSIGAVLQGDSRSFDLNARVPAVWMHPADPSECEQSSAVRWRGFTPLRDYLQAANVTGAP
ncbi:MAG: hypothetical protein IT319_01730 [Anaerolineae bacterium]|nr:hypothetical protein [Anaerolineae bacterium]